MADTDTEVEDTEMEDELPVGNNIAELLKKKDELLASADASFLKMKAGKKFDRKDVMKAMSNFRQVVRIQEQLSNMIINDLMVVDQRFSQLEGQNFQMIQQVSTLTTTLMNKSIVTKEDIQKTWEEEVKPKLEAKLKAAREQMEVQQAVGASGEEKTAGTLIVPDKTLVGPDGNPL